VKRRRSLPLLRAVEPQVYLIDSSAWLNVDLRPDAEDVWQMIVNLIEQGRIVACASVLNELRDDPIFLLRLKPFERALQVGDRSPDDIEYLQQVGRITHDYPAMSKATGSKTLADPYIVALAEIEGYIVVTDETCKKRPTKKIPGVCQKLSIRCLTLAEFVKEIQDEDKPR
jgi:hypothetical protein